MNSKEKKKAIKTGRIEPSMPKEPDPALQLLSRAVKGPSPTWDVEPQERNIDTTGGQEALKPQTELVEEPTMEPEAQFIEPTADAEPEALAFHNATTLQGSWDEYNRWQSMSSKERKKAIKAGKEEPPIPYQSEPALYSQQSGAALYEPEPAVEPEHEEFAFKPGKKDKKKGQES